MAKVVSELYEYIGISNTTITKGLTYDIEVVIPEFTPLAEGEPGKYTIEQTTLEDPINKTTKTTKVKTVRTVVCTYMGSGNVNGIVPCVHKGERVRVLNYAGTEQYYWLAYGKDPGLRLRERARWFVMDQPKSVENGDYKKVEDENTYFVELNTNKGAKEFHVHTSINDGETYTYDIRIIPEKCILEITDNAGSNGPDKGNVIRLRSKDKWWHIRNTDESVIDINKKNIIIRCQDTISMIAGKNIVTKCGMTRSEFVGMEKMTFVGVDSTEIVGGNKTEMVGANKNDICANKNNMCMGEGAVSEALTLLAASPAACSSVTAAVASQGAGNVPGNIQASVFGANPSNSAANGSCGGCCGGGCCGGKKEDPKAKGGCCGGGGGCGQCNSFKLTSDTFPDTDKTYYIKKEAEYFQAKLEDFLEEGTLFKPDEKYYEKPGACCSGGNCGGKKGCGGGGCCGNNGNNGSSAACTGGSSMTFCVNETKVDCKSRVIDAKLDIIERSRNRVIVTKKNMFHTAGKNIFHRAKETHTFVDGDFSCDCPTGHTGSIILIGSNVW